MRIGSTLAATPGDSVFCPNTCTMVQSALSGSYAAAPVDGVITRWRVRTGAPGGPLGLRIARPFGATERIGAGSSGLVSASAAGVNEFATRLPISTGDNIGLSFTSDTNVQFKPGSGVPGATALYFTPQLTEDGRRIDASAVNNNTELLFNADLELDVDRDGFGDETQDRCLGVNGPSNGCDVAPPTPVLVTYGPQGVGKLKIKVSVNEPSAIEAQATVSYKSKGKKGVVKSKRAKLSSVSLNIPFGMNLSFTSKQKSKLRSLIASGKKLSAKVNVTATDPSGNKAVVTAKIKLKR